MAILFESLLKLQVLKQTHLCSILWQEPTTFSYVLLFLVWVRKDIQLQFCREKLSYCRR